jgi:HEAT repeat protein
LQDTEQGVRQDAALALGEIGGIEAIDAARNLSSDGMDYYVYDALKKRV